MTGISSFRLIYILFSLFILAYSTASQACVDGCVTENAEKLRLEDSISSVAVGDLNHDGMPDIVAVGDYFDEGIHIYYQGTDKRFKFPESFYFPETQTGDSVGLGDFNSDGNADIVVTTNLGIRILLRDDQGQFTSNQYYPITSDHKLRVGDFNNDGRDDVAAIGWGNKNLTVLLQNASGTMESAVNYSAIYAGWNDLDVGDLNNDGLTDIIVMSGQLNNANGISIFYQNNSGTFDPATYFFLPSGNNPGGIGIGDINGDKLNDLVVVDDWGSELIIYTQNISNTLNAPIAIPSGSSTISGAIEIADMNQDDLDDIVYVTAYGGLSIHLQDGNGGLKSPVYGTGGHASSNFNPHGSAVADLDADGKTDVVVATRLWMGGVDVHYGTHADLKLTLSTDKTTALVEERIQYTATITNQGPDDSRDVKLEKFLPTGMFTDAGVRSSQGSCDIYNRVCTLGALKPGQTATVTYEAYAHTDPGTYTSSVNITAYNYSALTKTASVDIEVTAGSDLDIYRHGVNNPVTTDNIYYYAYIQNKGIIDAEGVVISDVLPPNVTPVTAVWGPVISTVRNNCLITAGRVDCEVGHLARNDSVVISIQVQVNTNENILNTITATAQTPDPILPNNSVTQLSTALGIDINQPPIINNGGPYTVHLGSTAMMDGRKSKDPEGTWLSYIWDFADGTQRSYRHVKHTFNTAGQAPVTVTVTDEDGASSTETFYVNVINSPPHAYAGPPYHLQDKKREIAFDAKGSYDTDGGPITYHWDFGDGNTATGSRVFNAYALSGNYTATLTVDDGYESSSATTNAVILNTIPRCRDGLAYTYQRNTTINFTGEGYDCVDTDNDTLSYSWDFGDGNTSTGESTTHTYTRSGVYTVTLLVNDGEENSKPVFSTYTITNDAPIANGAGPYTAVKGQTLTLDGSASSDADNDILTYRWNLGDGTTATGVNPTHIYNKGGRYKVKLIVNDGEVDSVVYDTTVSVKNR